MGDTKAELVSMAKSILGLTSGENDALLELLTQDTINAVLSYCRIDVLPRQLEGFIPIVTAARFTDNANSGVKVIAEGERRVEYGDTKTTFLDAYADRLKPFISRRVYVPSEISKGDTEDE